MNRPNFRQVLECARPRAQEYSNCKRLVLFHTFGRMDIAAPRDGRTPGKSGTAVPHSKTLPRLRTLLPSSAMSWFKCFIV